MAWFRNTNSSRTEPSAQEWGQKGYDSQGSMLNYSSTVYTQSHMSQTERILRFGLVNDDGQRVYSPPQIILFKDHGDDINKHSHFPPIMVYGSPKKAEGFSPKERLKGAPWNSAGYKNHSPFSWDDDHRTDDLDDDNYDRHEGYEGPYSPKPVHTKPAYDNDYYMGSTEGAGGKPSFVPPAGMHQQYMAPVSTSPNKDTYPETARNRPIGRSPPRNKPETDTRSHKTSWKPLFEPAAASHPQYPAPVSASPKRDAYRETSRNRPIGHSPPRRKPETDTQFSKTGWKPLFEQPPGRHPHYSASIPTSPKKDMHYETANNRPIGLGPLRSKPETVGDYAVESPKASKQTSFVRPTGKHPHYYAPDTIPPKKDTYYDTADNRPLVPNPPQGKPVSDTGYASDSPKAGRNHSFGSLSGRRPQPTTPVKDSYYETANNSKPAHDNGKVSAHAMTRPGKEGHQQTIDSNEARERFGGVAVNQPEPEEYIETIYCREAAWKYDGVFV